MSTQPTTPEEVLAQARALITDPERWTQGVLARTREGRPITPVSPNAWQLCAFGALDRVCDYDPDQDDLVQFPTLLSKSLHFLNAAAEAHPSRSVTSINDYLGHADVLWLYDEALRRARLEGAPDAP